MIGVSEDTISRRKYIYHLYILDHVTATRRAALFLALFLRSRMCFRTRSKHTPEKTWQMQDPSGWKPNRLVLAPVKYLGIYRPYCIYVV